MSLNTKTFWFISGAVEDRPIMRYLNVCKHMMKGLSEHTFQMFRSTPAVADLRGGARDAPPPPRGPKFFHFHAVFDQKNRFTYPLWELAPPPGENPGSATVQ